MTFIHCDLYTAVTIDRHRLYDSDDDVSNNSSDDESDESKYNYASSTSDDYLAFVYSTK